MGLESSLLILFGVQETEEPDRMSAPLNNTVKYSSAGREKGPKAELLLRCSDKKGQKLTSVVLDILEF